MYDTLNVLQSQAGCPQTRTKSKNLQACAFDIIPLRIKRHGPPYQLHWSLSTATSLLSSPFVNKEENDLCSHRPYTKLESTLYNSSQDQLYMASTELDRPYLLLTRGCQVQDIEGDDTTIGPRVISMIPREELLGTRDFSARHVQDTRASHFKALPSNKGGSPMALREANF
ncbi:hypothetical protein BCR43DRAFT_241368 [Syncephalastrum racemosum]|uniref:Uncharacterized protein n=1 Tax=Syncephalastrum racemosum TaxID=13706 RepID=A0A1X2HEY4_SYNRA|nr:hypothetical protein BCR43DRAFT_241368 [Syncephalastrum racemosum]